MNTKKLLKELKQKTFVMLKPSAVEGIGIFAITSIKKGERKIFSKDKSKWRKISKKQIENLPRHSKNLVETYCLYDDKNYFIPEYGFKIIDLVIFLNHSDTPNIASFKDGKYFKALRDIEAGEELFVNYGTIVDT